jgi:hypothetical protein
MAEGWAAAASSAAATRRQLRLANNSSCSSLRTAFRREFHGINKCSYQFNPVQARKLTSAVPKEQKNCTGSFLNTSASWWTETIGTIMCCVYPTNRRSMLLRADCGLGQETDAYVQALPCIRLKRRSYEWKQSVVTNQRCIPLRSRCGVERLSVSLRCHVSNSLAAGVPASSARCVPGSTPVPVTPLLLLLLLQPLCLAARQMMRPRLFTRRMHLA